MKKHMTRSLCCLLALLLCLGSAIYTPAAQDDQAQVSFTVTLATGKATDYATLKVQDKDGKTMPCQEDEYGYDTYDYLLPAGDYTYTATYQSGSQTASGNFTVAAGESRRISVQLTYTQYKVRFNTTPQNATVALYKNGASGAYGDPILPDEQGYYTIIFGQYRYIVAKRDAGDFVLLSQLRVRWWAFNSDNLAGIERDRQRLVGQGDLLMEFPE